MGTAYLVITILLAPMLVYSGIGKLRRDPRIVQVIHELVGVPMKYFPLLAACEFAHLVVSFGYGGRYRARPLFCVRDYVASACWRFKRDWTWGLFLDTLGGSTRNADRGPRS